MSELLERLNELKGVSDKVYAPDNSARWGVSLDESNFHDVCTYLKRDYEPAAVILKILENSHSEVSRIFLTGGSDMRFDFCITGSSYRDLSKALRDDDFFITNITEGRKNRLVGAELEIPGHGRIRVGFGMRCLSGAKEL